LLLLLSEHGVYVLGPFIQEGECLPKAREGRVVLGRERGREGQVSGVLWTVFFWGGREGGVREGAWVGWKEGGREGGMAR
jgi:hypothetical protein